MTVAPQCETCGEEIGQQDVRSEFVNAPGDTTLVAYCPNCYEGDSE